MDKINILYICDDWKSRDSLRAVFATTDRKTLYAEITRRILIGEMDYGGINGKPGIMLFKEDMDEYCLDLGKLSYGFVEEFNNVIETDRATPISARTTLYHYLEKDIDTFLEHLTSEIDIAAGQDDDLDEDLEP